MAKSKDVVSAPVVAPDFSRARARLRAGQLISRYKIPAVVGAMMLVAVLSAIFAPQLAPYDPNDSDLASRLQPPMWAGGTSEHILGTDHLGRDLLSRLLWGGRVSLLVGFTSVIIAGLLGVTLGMLAGYYRGLTDEILMRIVDVQLSFPFLALAIAVVAVLGPSLGNVVIVLGVSGWVLFARVVRAEILGLREKEFIEAARAIGVQNHRIMLRHLLPNIVGPVTVIASFAFAIMIITEASLSFLGLGVPPATPTWGGMLNDSRDYLALAGWLATFPGLALLIIVLMVNTLGDWLRDETDPRLRLD